MLPLYLAYTAGIFFAAPHAIAKEEKPSAESHYSGASPSVTGTLGLNTVPSARMDEVGTIRAGISTSDPYVHAFMGFQLAKPLYVSLRQSGEVSNLTQEPDA
ncbi:MAG TPA: YjbH domain-containing protein, partial [Alphaproteobacteria bacterium]|nr:YjbH domain-containing protein [Alphaproteobacteria bacterium]